MRSYPQETPEIFIEYISKVMDEYPKEDYYFIFGILVNDENANDNTLGAYLFKNEVPVFLIRKLINVREYFWDLRYSNLLWENKY